MADNSPHNHSYMPLRNVDEGHELASLQSDPGQPHPNPTPGQPFNQQTQPPPQQPLTVQAQPPPPQTGVEYYTQPYPAVSGTGRYSEMETHHSPSHYPSPHTSTATGGYDPARDARCGHTADFHNTRRHNAPQVRLCDQYGGYNHLHSAVLAARIPLPCASYNPEYHGEYHTSPTDTLNPHTSHTRYRQALTHLPISIPTGPQ